MVNNADSIPPSLSQTHRDQNVAPLHGLALKEKPTVQTSSRLGKQNDCISPLFLVEQQGPKPSHGEILPFVTVFKRTWVCIGRARIWRFLPHHKLVNLTLACCSLVIIPHTWGVRVFLKSPRKQIVCKTKTSHQGKGKETGHTSCQHSLNLLLPFQSEVWYPFMSGRVYGQGWTATVLRGHRQELQSLQLTPYYLRTAEEWPSLAADEGSPLFTAWLVQGWPRALTSYKRTPRQRLCSVLSPPNLIHVSPFGSTLNLWCKILPNLRNACSAATTPLALRELSWSLWSDDLPPRYRHCLLVLANTWLFHIIKGAP